MTEKHKTERLGVNAAEKAFLKIDWLFREQPISDFGIDAHAEPKDDYDPTGQLIALQIKSGRSFFKTRGKNVVFQGEERHLIYWKNHVLPVYIILHDPENDLNLWQKVSDHLITYHDEGRWSIEVPPDQVLDEKASKFMQRGISSDEASIRRFRMALDLPLIREIRKRSLKEVVFLTLDEWVNKTLNFRERKLRFHSPSAEPEYEFHTWLG